MPEQLHSIGLAARNEEKRRQRAARSAERAARMERDGFTKDGKVVPDPHPEQVTVWHLNPDSRSTPMTPTSKGVWTVPFRMLHREVLLIPTTGTLADADADPTCPCADCGKQARFTVIENALEPDVHGWQWCGRCQVG